ncbi:hypothetical protein HHL22_20910 [Hymenobacter sp. RP-2-7]|uniref:Uncharacterized protein n=1 Tax=Hymenobacter polaris TaxID=2682546 RepID=A0A7Y0AHV9_9BACT|nr:hypothetical protein [Hymenobacter polaris]NML67669.1 hypothetical protein [Hymenobacter polaris]
MPRPLFLLLGLLASAAVARAQSLPVITQNPPGLRWQQVQTPHFRVLYPLGLDTAAQRTAARLEALHQADGQTLGVEAHPVAVVLQNQTTVSNGFVTFLPRHAEFFTTPDQTQGLGTVDWLDGLAVHEFRHVNQFDKARQGFGRVVVPLLGEGGLGVAAVGVPQWFFEGDAVGTETALTRSGRGRIPLFGVGLRANLLSGLRYGYQEAVNGSLRDNVPNWYVLGYYLTSYAKAHYGANVWRRALDQYYRFPFYPFSFSNGLRRTTGLRVEDLYQRTMAELDSTWRAELAARPAPTPVTELAGQPASRVFTQYQFPQYVSDSTLLVLKSGLGDIQQLVLLSRRRPLSAHLNIVDSVAADSIKRHLPDSLARHVFTLGPLNLPDMLSVGGGRAAWVEFRQQPRWGQVVYSEVKVLDLATGRVHRLARGTRYTAAALSPDGRQLVVTQTSPGYHHALLVLDANTGQVLHTLPNPRNDFYQQPRFLADGRLVAVALSAAGKTLQLLNPATGQTQNLLPVANVNLANPQPWGDYVLYNSPQTGVDNVFAVSQKNGLTYQVTNRPYGAYHATVSPDGRHLAFHDYRATGARVVEMPLDPATWLALPTPARQDAPAGPYAEKLAAGEPAAPHITALLASPDSVGPRYGVRRYRPLAHAFRLFSYGVVQSPDGANVSLGVRSQDYLSTTQVFAGLLYNQTERTLGATGALSYQGLPVVLDAEISYQGRNAARYFDRARPLDSLRLTQWQVARVLLGGRLPLVLTRGKYLQALTLGAYYLGEQVYNYVAPSRSLYETGPTAPLHAVQTYLSYASQLKQSARDVAPRGGGTLLATYRTTPFGTALQATQVGVQAGLYLPGLGRHHALRLRGGFQYQQQSQYAFASAISFPRVEPDYLSFDRLAVGSADYNLPLAYLHAALGRVLYVQRLRATAFGDFARGSNLLAVQQGRQLVNQRFLTDFYNAGVDFWVLFNVFHLRTPLEAGVRIGYSSLRQQVLVQPLAFSVRL